MQNNLKKVLLLSAIALSCTLTHAKKETYIIDPFHTNARFLIDHFNTSSNFGGFFELTGTLKYDDKKQTGSIKITIPIKSLQTSSKEFTEHLKSKEFFNEAKYPNMKFVSSTWTSQNGKPSTILGKLTLLGVTKPVTLKVDKFNCYKKDVKKPQKTCGADLSTTIDRTQWGMKTYADMADSATKNVTLNIQVEAEQK